MPNEQNEVPNLSDEEIAFLDSVFDLAREGHTAELSSLIESGVPVNLTNAKGDTLLILAAYHRHAQTVTALLAADADPDRVNDMGQTALSAATFRNDEPIVLQLLEAGANPHHGPQAAVAVAKQFGLTNMETIFETHEDAQS